MRGYNLEIYYKITDSQDTIIIDNIPDKLSNLYDTTVISAPSKKVEIEGSTVRVIKIKNERHNIFALTKKAKYLKSSRTFTTEINLILDCMDNALSFKNNFIKESQEHINRLIHNLVTLNAHNMQEVYSIIPQEVLANKRSKQWKKSITDHVEEDLTEAALSLVRIAKNSLKMKSEISVYNSFRNDKVKLDSKIHHIHRVLMNMFYVFFPDFTDKGVLVDVAKTQLQATFDYETVTVALYYIIDNIVKYIKPNSELKVSIDKEQFNSNITITFDMISIKVSKDELEKIFEDGVSGIYAIQCGKSGQGIGMCRARELLKLNNIDVSFESIDNTEVTQLQYCYQRNIVKMVI